MITCINFVIVPDFSCFEYQVLTMSSLLLHVKCLMFFILTFVVLGEINVNQIALPHRRSAKFLALHYMLFHLSIWIGSKHIVSTNPNCMVHAYDTQA
jgi:hypothetical protein